MKLKGKVAIVTGGGQGIGRGIARCLAGEGADVAVVSRNGDSAMAVAGEIESMGRKAIGLKADVTVREHVDEAVSETVKTFDRIDILVNSVGGGGVDIGLFMDLQGSEWDRTFDLNVKSQVNMCRAVVPHFQAQESGKIVNIASIAGKKAMPMNAPYGASKAAAIYLSKALAVELGGQNINVNCVCPGVVYTPTFATLIDKYMIRPGADGSRMSPREFFDRFIVPASPFKREITTEDVGKAVVFLCSAGAGNITGQTVNITAGTALEID